MKTTRTNEHRSSRKLESTAYAEAGAAVTYIQQHLGFQQASIVPSENSLRFTAAGMSDELAQSRDRAEGHVVYWASQVAESKFSGRPLRRRPLYGSEDVADVLAAYFCRTESEQRAFQAAQFSKARDLVERHWREVEALAGALLDRHRLSFADAVRIVSEAGATTPVH
jgi:hypothetical protein